MQLRRNIDEGAPPIVRLARSAVSTRSELRRRFLGQAAREDDFDAIVGEGTECFDKTTGRLVFRLCKSVLSPAACASARGAFSDIDERERPSVTRRTAAGLLDVLRFQKYRDDVEDIVPLTATTGLLKLRGGRVLKQPMSNPVHSYLAGYSFERFERRAVVSLLTRRYPEKWQAALPFFQEIDAVLATQLPTIHAKHVARCNAHPAWRIPGTSLSTVTINVNYESSYHFDVGDYKDGYSTLSVVQSGDYDGGLLVFPAYRIAVDVREGDLLLCQSHVDMHGNTPIRPLSRGAKRVSFVTYLKHKLAEAVNRHESPNAEHNWSDGKRV